MKTFETTSNQITNMEIWKTALPGTQVIYCNDGAIIMITTDGEITIQAKDLSIPRSQIAPTTVREITYMVEAHNGIELVKDFLCDWDDQGEAIDEDYDF